MFFADFLFDWSSMDMEPFLGGIAWIALLAWWIIVVSGGFVLCRKKRLSGAKKRFVMTLFFLVSMAPSVDVLFAKFQVDRIFAMSRHMGKIGAVDKGKMCGGRLGGGPGIQYVHGDFPDADIGDRYFAYSKKKGQWKEYDLTQSPPRKGVLADRCPEGFYEYESVRNIRNGTMVATYAFLRDGEVVSKQVSVSRGGTMFFDGLVWLSTGSSGNKSDVVFRKKTRDIK